MRVFELGGISVIARFHVPVSRSVSRQGRNAWRVVIAAFIALLASTPALADYCGRLNERPCNINEYFPSCATNLVAAGTACIHPNCGAEGQPQCNVAQRPLGTTCDIDLMAQSPGISIGGAAPACKHPPGCGHLGERACNIWERIPSCDHDLVEGGGQCNRPACGNEGNRPCTLFERPSPVYLTMLVLPEGVALSQFTAMTSTGCDLDLVADKAISHALQSTATGQPANGSNPTCRRPGTPPFPSAAPAPAAAPVASSAHGAVAVGIEVGTDRPGNDYRSATLTSADPALCMAMCNGDAQCRAWTYTNPGVKAASAVCFLKSAVPPPVADACCSSGVGKPAVPIAVPKVTPAQLGAPKGPVPKNTPPPTGTTGTSGPGTGTIVATGSPGISGTAGTPGTGGTAGTSVATGTTTTTTATTSPGASGASGPAAPLCSPPAAASAAIPVGTLVQDVTVRDTVVRNATCLYRAGVTTGQTYVLSVTGIVGAVAVKVYDDPALTRPTACLSPNLVNSTYDEPADCTFVATSGAIYASVSATIASALSQNAYNIRVSPHFDAPAATQGTDQNPLEISPNRPFGATAGSAWSDMSYYKVNATGATGDVVISMTGMTGAEDMTLSIYDNPGFQGALSSASCSLALFGTFPESCKLPGGKTYYIKVRTGAIGGPFTLMVDAPGAGAAAAGTQGGATSTPAGGSAGTSASSGTVAAGLDPDENLIGGGYLTLELTVPDPASCQAVCSAEINCTAFTYTKPGIKGANAFCELKRGAVTPAHDTCCVSGLRPNG